MSVCTRIPIVDDVLDENDEDFDLTMNTTEPDMRVAPNSARVIIDDESECMYIYRSSTNTRDLEIFCVHYVAQKCLGLQKSVKSVYIVCVFFRRDSRTGEDQYYSG